MWLDCAKPVNEYPLEQQEYKVMVHVFANVGGVNIFCVNIDRMKAFEYQHKKT